ncbi:hypothetical protein BaRGS_00007118 [Batillaria attramentaria]|uniref:Uncharacterized protein n=1 Tax=Batillaria attramentaria TaxID=370345 RepID=A0ABD0LRM9_9CAEN
MKLGQVFKTSGSAGNSGEIIQNVTEVGHLKSLSCVDHWPSGKVLPIPVPGAKRYSSVWPLVQGWVLPWRQSQSQYFQNAQFLATATVHACPFSPDNPAYKLCFRSSSRSLVEYKVAALTDPSQYTF